MASTRTLKPPFEACDLLPRLPRGPAGARKPHGSVPSTLPAARTGKPSAVSSPFVSRLPCPALHVLADACVVELDRHRAPPSEHGAGPAAGGRARPRAGGDADRPGAIPYVLETWFFHLTLTRRLTPDSERRTLWNLQRNGPGSGRHLLSRLAHGGKLGGVHAGRAAIRPVPTGRAGPAGMRPEVRLAPFPSSQSKLEHRYN